MQRSRPKTEFVRRKFEDIEPGQWNDLLRRSSSRNLFYDRGVLLAAFQAWPRIRPTGFFAGYRGDQLVLLQPYREKRNLMGATLELLEIPTADHIEPLMDERARDEIAMSFGDYLLRGERPDLLIARSLTESFCTTLSAIKVSGGRSIHVDRRVRGWCLDLPDSLERFRTDRSTNFRSELGRKLRKAAAAGLRLRTVSADELPPDYDSGRALATLTSLHQQRFDSLQRSSFFLRSEFRRFHERLMDTAPEGACMVTFTELLDGSRVVGSLYGLRTADAFLFLMAGFDPHYRAFSPGSLLLYKTVEELIALGVRRFDLKCGTEPYKQRWASRHYDKVDLQIAVTWRGRLLQLLHSLASSARGRFRPGWNPLLLARERWVPQAEGAGTGWLPVALPSPDLEASLRASST